MVSTFVVAALLAAVAIGTWLWQRAAWRAQKHSELSRPEHEFYRRRHRRRSQISLLLGVVAVSMVVGIWILNPLVVGFLWMGVLLVLLWILILAFLDAAASHLFFDRLHARQLAEQVALQREILKHSQEDEAE